VTIVENMTLRPIAAMADIAANAAIELWFLPHVVFNHNHNFHPLISHSHSINLATTTNPLFQNPNAALASIRRHSLPLNRTTNCKTNRTTFAAIKPHNQLQNKPHN
jgi:hypothetical protein